MALEKNSSSLMLLAQVLFIFLHVINVSSVDNPEIQALLKFKDSLIKNSALSNWIATSPPCNIDGKLNWVGVLCNKEKLWGLKLENMGFEGGLDLEPLKELKGLISISIMNNSFDGSWPDIKKLATLKSLYFSHNRFSGEIPGDAFENMASLKKLHLDDNQFKGAIPSSLKDLPLLSELRLEKNHFTGEIPNFQKTTLRNFNVSQNELEGPIPPFLAKLDSSSFSGNQGLCGEPLATCDHEKREDPNIDEHKSQVSVVTIVVVVLLLITIAAAIFFYLRKDQKKEKKYVESFLPVKKTCDGKEESVGSASSETSSSVSSSPDRPGGKKGDHHVKLSFVRDDGEKFGLKDLLKASAEMLGSGSFGSSYKAALLNNVMVVKRYKQMNNMNKEEFQEHMRRIGRLRNPNLLSLVAFYYYKKEEKLLISDFVAKGSLAAHLHGTRYVSHPSLDWPTRLKIVKGIAMGLQYLFKELPSLTAPHGHLKSSNVLLDESFRPLLSDYALIPLINQDKAQQLMVAYKSPEFLQQGRITKKSDIWSFGLLILEILTGKFPAKFLQKASATDTDEDDLGTWVRSMLEEERTEKVFDVEMGETENSEGQMLKLLEIGLACYESDLDKRLDFSEAIERIEELNVKDDGNEDGDEKEDQDMC